MSQVVATMQKFKQENLNGIGRHNERKTDDHKNSEIDKTKTWQNYNLVSRPENISIKKDIENYIAKKRNSSKALRKDAVLVSEWVISSDQNFFKNLDSSRAREFFKASKKYFSDKFGAENIRYAIVHMDETTPHMHMGIVPMTADGRLSAKDVFTRQTLKEVQDELPRRLNELGFDIERGEKGSKRKKLSIPEYKQLQEELKLTSQELAEAKNELKQVNSTLKAENAKLAVLEQFKSIPEEVNQKLSELSQISPEIEREHFTQEISKIEEIAEEKKKAFSQEIEIRLPQNNFLDLIKIAKDAYLLGFERAKNKGKSSLSSLVSAFTELKTNYQKLLEETAELKWQLRETEQELKRSKQIIKDMPTVEEWNGLFSAFEREVGRKPTLKDLESLETRDNPSLQLKSHGEMER